MKKFIYFILVILITLTACSKQNVKTNVIMPYELSKEEDKLFYLLSLKQNTKIYQYNTDQDTKKITLKIYTLNNNREWENIGNLSGSNDTLLSSSRIAITMNNDIGVSLGIENENGASNTTFNISDNYNLKNKLSSISWSDTVDIIFEEEIPLMMYISTNSESLQSFDPSNFYNTDEIIDYENAICVTVLFEK